MKPRLEPAPLTTEDYSAWGAAIGRADVQPYQIDFKAQRRVFESYRAADRRDADIMLFLGTDGRAGFMPRRWRRAVRAYQGVTINPETGAYVW